MKTSLLILGLVILFATNAGAAERVVLRDGTVLNDAVILRLSPASYIVQTAGALYELSEDELDPEFLHQVDFRNARPPIVTHHYDEIHSDGTVTSYFSIPIFNDGKKAVTDTRWGLAPWERSHAEQRRYVDSRGTTLIPAYDPPPSKWATKPGKRVQVTLPLAVPLAPGERMNITGKETSSQITKTDEGLMFRHPGDFAEDRLVWRKIRLPRGAHIVRVTPQPSARFSYQGHTFLTWRHFYKKGEQFPLEVIFTLE